MTLYPVEANAYQPYLFVNNNANACLPYAKKKYKNITFRVVIMFVMDLFTKYFENLENRIRNWKESLTNTYFRMSYMITAQ